MAALTVSNYLGMLQEDPDSEVSFEGLKAALGSKDPDILGDSPLRMLELARAGHERRGEVRAAAWLIEVEANFVDDDPDFRAALLKELGRIRQEELLDSEAALTAFQGSLDLKPGDDDIEEAVEQMQQAAANWRQIVDRFVEEAHDASDATVRTSFLAKAGSLVWQYREKGRAKETDKLFRDALKSDPGDVRAARLYTVTLKKRERWQDVARILSNAADAARNRDEKLNFYVQAARIYIRHLDAEPKAAASYERALDLSPGHAEALGFLVEYFTVAEDWDKLVALYEEALRSRQKLESERGILLQLGMVHWRIRGSADDAEPYFARLRKIDPGNPGMLGFYREFLEGEEGQQRLLTILGDAQRVAGDEQKLGLALEVARQAQQSDATLERAIDAWKAVQRLDASNEEANGALRDLYRRGEKWNALVEVMRSEIDALPDDGAERRVALLRELVPIYREHLQLDVMVINTFNAILQDEPGDADALRELATTYESMGRWNDLIQVLTRQADGLEDVAAKVDLYMRVANLWIERFANYNQATKPLEAIIEVDPEHREALSQLKEIYTKKRAWKNLYQVMRKESELASDPDARLHMRVELARLAGDRLHRHADAIELWKEIIELAPETDGALDALEKLSEREKDWATLGQALELRVDRTEDVPRRIKIFQKLGTVYGEHLDDPARAAGAWQRILEVDPKNGRALRTLREAFLAAGDWDGLEGLYAEAQDWEGLVEVLGKAAEKAEERDVKVQLSFRAASIYEDRIGEPHRAFRNYERVLSVDSSNEQAARALIPIYQKDEKWPRLVGLYEILLMKLPADEHGQQLELLAQLRDLCHERLSDDAGAFGWARRAYSLAPTDAEVIEALEKTAAASGRFQELLDTFAARVEATEDDAERSTLRRKIASIAGESLGQTDESIAQLTQILERDPTDAEAIEVLDRLYRSEGRTADLKRLYVHRLEHVEDGAERHTLLGELAALEEDLLGDADAAATRYRAILELEPADGAALVALDRLALAGERWQELADTIGRRAELADADDERLELTLRLAEVRAGQLEDAEGALDAYGGVLDLEPGNGRAVLGLEAIAEAVEELAPSAGALLEAAYEAQGESAKLADILRARLGRTTDDEDKRTLQLRLAELAAELGDPVGAYAALEAAFLDRPDDVELWDRLASAADGAEQHENLAAAFATALEAGGLGEADATDLSRRVAELYDIIIGQPERAEPFHKAVLHSDALDAGAFLALKELYTNGEKWDELQLLYRNRIAETIDGEAKLDLLLQVCFLFEEILDDPKLAIRSYQDVLELDPEHVSSRRSLDRLYRRTERWRDLAALLRQDLEQAEGHDQLELTFELGELYEQKLDEPTMAVDFYERVLEQHPTHLRSQEALERLLAEQGQRQRIAAILEPLYDEQGAWAELARVLEVQLEDVGDPGSQVGLLTRIGELHEQKLHDMEGAFGALARAVQAEPADPGVREQLARLAAVRGAQRERAEVLEKAIEASEGTNYLQSELLLELARLWDDNENDFEAAEKAYGRLIDIDGENPDVVLPASQALERIHLQQENYPALAEDLRRQVRFEHDQELRQGLLVRLAELLDTTLDDVDGAVRAHRQRLDIDPMDEDALRALERLYERKEEWNELIGVLQSREQAADHEDEQREICRRVGEVYEQKLEDVDNAIVAYNEVLSRFTADADTLAALARLYRAGERWDDLLEILEMQRNAAEDSEAQAELRFAAAELLRTKIDEVERAVESYSEVLAVIPGHEGTVNALEEIVTAPEGDCRVEAARVLVPHYEGNHLYGELIGALEVVADTDDPIEKLNALRRAADVADVGLESPETAFDLMGRAVRAGVSEEDLAEMLGEYERLAATSEKWGDYASLLEDVSPDILDGDLQTDVLMKVASVCRERLEDRDRARGFYGKVLENRPEHGPALDALEALHAEAADYPALLDVLTRKAEIAELPEERVPLLLRQAEICEQHLDDVPAAIDALEQVLNDAERPEAFAGLERLYSSAERHEDLASMLERQLDAQVGDPVEVRYRLGRVQVEHLNDAYAALDSFRETLAQDGNHDASIVALEALMADEEHRGAAAEILEPVFLARMDWPKVTGALEARLASENGLDERKELLRRLGEIHEDYLEDLDGALETYARLFREDPADTEFWETLNRLAKVLDKWVRLAEIYAEALERITVDEPETARLAFTTGQLYDTKGGDPAKAAPFFARALAFDPTDKVAFDALESAYERTEQWEPLLEAYRERVDVAESDEERVSLLHKAAHVREDKLSDSDAAIEGYRETLEVDPSDVTAIEALDRLLTAAERWHDLSDHLRFRIDGAAGTDEENDLKFRLGELSATRLDEQSAAVDIFEEVVLADPSHEAAVASLEGLVTVEEHKLRITQILEPIYRGQDEWRKLVAVLEAQVELSDDPTDSVRLLGEIARLHEERGDDGALAFRAWSRAFATEPHDETPRTELDRLAETLEVWDEHVAAYEQAIANTDDTQVVSQLLGTIARVHDERRGDPRAAIETYERLAEHDPDDGSPLDMLEALHTMVGDWRGMVDVLARKTERSYEPEERSDLLRRAGSVLEELLGDPAGAIDAYKRAAEEDDQDPVALEALDRLYVAANNHDELVGVLRRRAEVEMDMEEKVAVGLRLAQLCDTQLNHPDDAIDALIQVLDVEPGQAAAVTGLASLYERQAMWPELLENLQLQAGMAEEPSQRVALVYRAGEVLERQLDDVPEALVQYEQTLELDSRHEQSLQALIRIAKLEDYRTQAGDILEPLLLVQERWGELASLYDLKADGAHDPLDKAGFLKRLAEIRENGCQDASGAFEALTRALSETSEDPEILEGLWRLAAGIGAWDRLADTLSSRAANAMDPTVARTLYTRLATIAEEHLEDERRAIEAFVRALDQVGDDDELLAELDRLYTSGSRWSELANVLERRGQLAVDPTQGNELLVRLGQIRQEHFQDLRGAFAAFRDVIERDPADLRAMAALEGLTDNMELALDVVEVLDNAYRQTGATERVVALYDVRINLVDTDGERVRLLQEAANLWETDLGDLEKALASLRKAFELDPRDEAILEDIERLAGASGAWESLRGMIEAVSEGGDLDRMLLRDLNARAAIWYRDHLGDAEAAEARFRAALEVDPDAVEVHAQLVDLLRVGGREADLVAGLRAWADVEMDEYAKKDRLREAARLAESALSDIETAGVCHEGILTIDAADAEALDDLARIREGQERWPEVVELLGRRAEGEGDPSSRLALRRRIAEIHAGPIGAPAAAMDAYRAVLEEDPADLGAIGALETLYEGAERWEDLRELLDRRLELATSDQERIAARVRLARLVEQAFGRRADAMDQLRGILEIDPQNGEALDELERLLGLEGAWDDLVGLLEERIGHAAADPDTEVTLLGRLAEVHRDQRSDGAAAIGVYGRIAERRPDSNETFEALLGLHEAAGDWEQTSAVLDRLVDLREGLSAIQTAHRIAEIAEEQFEDAARTEAALRRAFDLDPASATTRELLKAHYDKHGEHAKLAELLALEEQEAEDASEKVTMLKRIAGLYQAQLGDPGTAAGYLERAAELVPEDREVLLPLCDLYIEAGRQQDAVPVLEKIISSFGTRRSKELAQFHHRLGNALEGMGDAEGAMSHYDSAFKIDLTNVTILRDLGKLCHGKGDMARAQKTFRALLLQKLKPEHGITKADVYFYLGDIANNGGDKRKAISMLERALTEEKEHAMATSLLATLKG